MADKLPEYKTILAAASNALAGFSGTVLDVLEVTCPPNLDYAVRLSKYVSKLSPIIGSMIEEGVVAFLNEKKITDKGKWVRQDPDFPDTILAGSVTPTPGIEIKAWCPFATEITARFKASSKNLNQDQTNVAILAWLPEHVLFGKPRILDVWIDTGSNIAASREKHYHKPPFYLLVEPEDTSSRGKNLQQTNVTPYIWQGTDAQLKDAKKIVEGWGPDGEKYSGLDDYQAKLRTLISAYKYRAETNFSKLDRIKHKPVKDFKKRVYKMKIDGLTVSQWRSVVKYVRRKDALKPILQALIDRRECEKDVMFREARKRKVATDKAKSRPTADSAPA